ncbi:unnamed protein product, partial [Didymodactylos carnosus]
AFENPNNTRVKYSAPKQFDDLQKNVDEVVDVMKNNLDKVLERDSKLTTLEGRADVDSFDRYYYWPDYYYCWATNGGGQASKRLAQTQAQVDEVVGIMKENVDKVLERDKNLSLLDDRADALQHNAAQFEQQAGKLKRKYWWKNCKMMIILGVVATIFTIILIAWIVTKVKAVKPVPTQDETSTAISPSDAGIPPYDEPAVKSGRKKNHTITMSPTSLSGELLNGDAPDQSVQAPNEIILPDKTEKKSV